MGCRKATITPTQTKNVWQWSCRIDQLRQSVQLTTTNGGECAPLARIQPSPHRSPFPPCLGHLFPNVRLSDIRGPFPGPRYIHFFLCRANSSRAPPHSLSHRTTYHRYGPTCGWRGCSLCLLRSSLTAGKPAGLLLQDLRLNAANNFQLPLVVVNILRKMSGNVDIYHTERVGTR